jgi:drug/metabolite transporter (DMT)-like permease
MLVAAFFFALMGLLVKLAGSGYSSTELVFYRSLVGLLAILAMAAPRPSMLATPHWRLHVQRSLCGIGSLWLYFFALTRLPLATAVTLNYTSPLFLALFSITMLRERAKPALLIALGLGFVGVVMLLKPHIGRDQLVVGLVGLVSGAFAGLAYANVRAMGALHEPEWRIVLYFTLLSTVLSGAALLVPLLAGGAAGSALPAWLPPAPQPLHWQNLPLLAGIGLCALIGQLCMTRAYRTGTLWLASNFAYSAIVFSSLFGLLFHGDWLSPMAWAGMAVIIAGGVLASWASDSPATESEL